MTIVDCPLCGTAAALPDDGTVLECPVCDVALELADAPAQDGVSIFA
jgi:uncharacterized Zn finger protein (UPF0148 family)